MDDEGEDWSSFDDDDAEDLPIVQYNGDALEQTTASMQQDITEGNAILDGMNSSSTDMEIDDRVKRTHDAISAEDPGSRFLEYAPISSLAKAAWQNAQK